MVRYIAFALTALALAAGCNAASAADHDQVKYTIDKWYKPGSNNIGTADITIVNGNDFAIKNVKIACHYMGMAAKKIETEQTIAVTVKAKTTKTFKKTKFPYIDMATATGNCELVSVSKG